MQPDFRIIANNQDVTARIRERLVSLRVVDEDGETSDTFSLTVDDSLQNVGWPTLGDTLTIGLGYKESAITLLGTYVVDEASYSAPPNTLSLNGKSADMQSVLKEHNNQHWTAINLDTMLEVIAGKYGLLARTPQSLADIALTDISQKDESDLHFLSRLAKDNNARLKLAQGYLTLFDKNNSTTVSAQPLPSVVVNQYDVLNYQMSQAERGRYNAVRAYWDDKPNGERREVIVGEGTPVYTIKHTKNDEQQARAAARSQLSALSRGVAKLSLTVIGRTDVFAHRLLRIENIRQPLDGDWLIKRVEHNLSAQGFITSIECETPSN